MPSSAKKILSQLENFLQNLHYQKNDHQVVFLFFCFYFISLFHPHKAQVCVWGKKSDKRKGWMNQFLSCLPLDLFPLFLSTHSDSCAAERNKSLNWYTWKCRGCREKKGIQNSFKSTWKAKKRESFINSSPSIHISSRVWRSGERSFG